MSTALLAVVMAIAATIGPLDWAPWRRMGLGWRFWMGLGAYGQGLAFGSAFGCIIVAVFGRASPVFGPGELRLYAWLSPATIILGMFVPAIAAL
ncbi:MAG: hypothetical protein ACYC61_20210 [Isosphaeraceae bacterium]